MSVNERKQEKKKFISKKINMKYTSKLILNWTEYEFGAESGWQPWANTLVYYNINDNDTNSTIYDLSWNNVDQTWIWTAWYTTDATYGRVAVFNGVSQTSANSIVDFWGEFTVIVLVKASSIPWMIFGEGSSGSRRPSIDAKFESSWKITSTCSWTSTRYAVETAVYPINTWYMITSTRNNNWDLKIYINGSFITMATSVPVPNYSGWDNFQIWKRYWEQNSLNWQFKLFIWENRCRSDAEIAALAQEYWFIN